MIHAASAFAAHVRRVDIYLFHLACKTWMPRTVDRIEELLRNLEILLRCCIAALLLLPLPTRVLVSAFCSSDGRVVLDDSARQLRASGASICHSSDFDVGAFSALNSAAVRITALILFCSPWRLLVSATWE